MTSAAYKEKNKAVTKILQKLTQTPEFRESKGDTGVPTIVWRGEIGADTITVTECLGPNLKKLFLLMDKQFSIPTIATIAIQVLNTLEYIHHHDYVCCNVMPKEILISLHKKSMTLFITDYKQARKVKSGRGAASEAVSHTTNKGILNKFSSVNLHLGLPASKKDDLESLAYILVYFFRNGHLFDKNKSKTFTKEEKMKFYEQQKLSLIPETFCQGLPQEMVNFMSHIKAMQTNKANEKIDYDYMRKLFKNLFQKNSSLETFQYDWMTKARTYNLENGKKSDEKNNLLENSFRSDVNSMQSPFNQATDFLIELEDYKDSGPTTNNTDVVVKKLFNFKSDEYNPWGMDEFAEENSEDQPIHLKFTKISVFQNKIQTIEDVKTRSLSAQGDELASRSHNEPLSQPQSKSEHEESQTDRIMSLPSKPSKEKIEKLGSETPPVDKISNFGKTYMREKSMKAK